MERRKVRCEDMMEIFLWIAVVQIGYGFFLDKPMWSFAGSTLILIIVIDAFLDKFLELYEKKINK